jgi:hypothetical protein
MGASLDDNTASISLEIGSNSQQLAHALVAKLNIKFI